MDTFYAVNSYRCSKESLMLLRYIDFKIIIHITKGEWRKEARKFELTLVNKMSCHREYFGSENDSVPK